MHKDSKSKLVSVAELAAARQRFQDYLEQTVKPRFLAKQRELDEVRKALLAERKQVEAMREELNTLEMALAGGNDGLWSWQIFPASVRLNAVAAVLLKRPTLVELSLHELLRLVVHPEDIGGLLAAVDSVLKGDTGQINEEFRIQAGYDSRQRWLHLRGRIVERDEQRRPLRLSGMISDITERREMDEKRVKLERQLLHMQKTESLGALAGGIAHDFNNLLMAVSGSAELARLDLPEGHPAHDSMGDIIKTAHHARELCDQLLAYAGRGRYVVSPIDLNELIKSSESLLGMTNAKRAPIEFALAAQAVVVDGDLGQMRQVLLNLVLNAVEACEGQRKPISVRTYSKFFGQAELNDTHPVGEAIAGTYACLEVRDQGTGMDEETRKRVFEPFFTTKTMGRGLGLSAVSGIVRAHGGVIKLRSAPGQGTQMTVLLPLSNSPASALPKVVSNVPSFRGTGRVLLVDDQQPVLTVAEKMLRRLGFDVLTASSGHEALELARAQGNTLRLCILDMIMPGMSGEETFKQLKSVEPRLPVIIATGFFDRELEESYAKRGYAGLLAKPYQFDDLARALQVALA